MAATMRNHLSPRLGLWLAAFGADSPTTEIIIAEKRVQFELNMEPVDAKGLMDEIKHQVRSRGLTEAATELASPLGQIRFMTLVDQFNAKQK